MFEQEANASNTIGNTRVSYHPGAWHPRNNNQVDEGREKEGNFILISINWYNILIIYFLLTSIFY